MHFNGGHFGGLARLGVDPSILTVGATTRAAAAPLQAGVCSADGEYILALASDGTLYWTRRLTGQSCNGTSTTNPSHEGATDNGGTDVVDSSTTHGPITLHYDFDDSVDASSTDPDAVHQALKVGPFVIPLGARRYTIHWEGLLPPDWRAFIAKELGTDCSNCVFSSMTDATEGHPLGALRDFFGPDLPSKVNKDLVTIPQLRDFGATSPDGTSSGFLTNIPFILNIKLPDQPIAVVTRPDTQETWGMYMVLMARDPTRFWDSTTNPYVLNFFWRKRPEGVWDWIKRIVGVLEEIHSVIHNAITGVACQLLPTTSKIPNVYTQAFSVLLTMTGECNASSCPAGTTFDATAKTCSCPAGMSYDVNTKTCVPLDTQSKFPWWLAVGLGLLGLGVLIKVKHEKKPAHHVAPAT